MKKRLKAIIVHSEMKLPAISQKTGIPLGRLKSAIYSDTRINEEIIGVVKTLWPEFLYWFISGETLPECGQTSPAEEEVKEAQKRLDQAIKKRNEKSG